MKSSQAYIFPILDLLAQKSIQKGYDVRKIEYLSDFNAYIDFICEEKNIPILQFKSPKRNRFLVDARQWACYYYDKFCRENRVERIGLTEMGRLIGKDHATVIHSIRAVQNMIDTDKAFSKDAEALYSKLIIKAD